MPAPRPLLAVLLGLVAGCTPLGAWLYEDPTYKMTGMNIVGVGSGTPSIEVVFGACNRNDFDQQAKRIAVAMRIGTDSVGAGADESSVLLVMRSETPLSVRIPIPDTAATLVADTVLRSYPFVLAGEGVVSSPMGDRTVRIAQHGRLDIRDARPVGWQVRDAVPCRPGQSYLPPAAGRTQPFPIRPEDQPGVFNQPAPQPPPRPAGEPGFP